MSILACLQTTLVRLPSLWATANSSLAALSSAQQPQIRSVWQEVIRFTRDPKDPSRVKYEDPSVTIARSARAQSAEGLLRRRHRYVYYEKPWMKRKRLKEQAVYKAKIRKVEELKAYIHFIQEHGGKDWGQKKK